jgi:uncharacterized membrane protein
MPEAKKPDQTHLWLWIIAILGFVVRVVTLTRESFWNDEAFSGWAAERVSVLDAIRVSASDVHPPGHFILGWIWGRLFGVNDFTLRLTSVIGGTLLILVAYRIGRQCFDRRTGLIGALLIAGLTQSIYYSQEFRAYIFLALFSALSVSVALDIAESNNRGEDAEWWRYALLAAISILNSYFHYFGLLFTFILVIVVIQQAIKRRRGLSQSIAVGVLLVVSYLPWIPTMVGMSQKRTYLQSPGIKEIGLLANIYFGPGFWMDAVAAALLVAGAILIYSKKRELRSPRQDLRLLGWIIVPLVASLAVTFLRVPVYSPRNLLLALIPATLLLARSLVAIGGRRASLPLAIAFLVVHHCFQFTHNGYFAHATKQQLREATRYVLDHRSPGEPIRVVGWDEQNIGYYLHQYGGEEDLRAEPLVEGHDPAENWPGQFWYISAGIAVVRPDLLTSRFQVLDQHDFFNARVYHLRRRSH